MKTKFDELLMELERIQGNLIREARRLEAQKKFEKLMQRHWWKFLAPVVPPLSAIKKVQETDRYIHWENVFWDGKMASAMFYRTRPATKEEQEIYEDEFVTHLLPGSPKPAKDWLRRIPYPIRAKEKPKP